MSKCPIVSKSLNKDDVLAVLNGDLDADILRLRSRLDRIDDHLAEILAERLQISKSVQTLKRENGRAVYDPDREARILERLGSRYSAEVVAMILAAIEICRSEEAPRARKRGRP